MASVYYLFDDAVHTEDSIVQYYEDNNAVSRREHFAAVKIQKHVRGWLVRKWIELLNESATLIQKTYRGWIVRYLLPDKLHEYYDRTCLKHINFCAAKIQATWKGYHFRKYEVCIKDIREERARREQANLEMQRMMKLQKELMMGGVLGGTTPQNINMLENIITVCLDRHHLLSTQKTKGVLSAPHSEELSELEKILKAVPWTDYMQELREIYNSSATREEKPPQYTYKHPKLKKQEDLLRQKDPNLETPPRPCFEKPKKYFDVYGGLIKGKPYERMITKCEKYRKPITAVLRTFDSSKNICEKDFDLNILKMVAKEAEVPPYYIDFWLSKCKNHNL
ncbi:unnamed protein product [Callosobruchus maculatus]|uniref:Spermatogenesis-associated protein 17 n=1 Tax=Callosobruchus maculatus TaxID=64391 RepID=A0A653DQ29_CALMS|nr:unnamed protein product [Callosobruchus maculatus]